MHQRLCSATKREGATTKQTKKIQRNEKDVWEKETETKGMTEEKGERQRILGKEQRERRRKKLKTVSFGLV